MNQPSTRSSIPSAFILPLVVFLVIANFYPDFAGSYAGDGFEDEPVGELGVTPETWQYIYMLGAQVLIAIGILVFFRKVYVEHFPIRLSPLSVVVGVVGVVLWVGVCQLNLEPRLLAMLGFDFSRPSFNPFTIEDNSVRILFLTMRFTVLALIVPIVEELFLRGWLVRWVHDPSWEKVGLTGLSLNALLAASIYGVATHPSEAIAAFLWFGMVTWLMNRTGNLWDCVVAHAVTNLLLGIYVMQFEQWHLW